MISLCLWLIDICRLRRRRFRADSAPWVTSEYLSMIDRRAYIAKLCDSCPCFFHEQLKTHAQRLCQCLKNQLKRNYVSNVLEWHKSNPKKIWKNIRGFWPSGKGKQNNIKLLNGKTTATEIANDLNEHFCSVGKRIQENIDNNIDFEEFMPFQNPPMFDFLAFDQTMIAEAIDNTSSSMSCSIDGITSLMIKTGKRELIRPLEYLYNLSIRTKVFPTAWKVAKVTLHKSGACDVPGNYRPISVIPTLGKILERLVYNQCQKYLNTHNLLCENQAGFREGRSTGTCLTEFLHDIYGEIERWCLWGAFPGPGESL